MEKESEGLFTHFLNFHLVLRASVPLCILLLTHPGALEPPRIEVMHPFDPVSNPSGAHSLILYLLYFWVSNFCDNSYLPSRPLLIVLLDLYISSHCFLAGFRIYVSILVIHVQLDIECA